MILSKARFAAALVLILTIAAAIYVHASWRRSQAEAFRSAAGNAMANVEMIVDRVAVVVRAVQALYSFNPNTTQAEFERFVPMLGRVTGIRGIVYYPLVRDAERAAFEAGLAAEGRSEIGIWQFAADGEPVAAPRRDVYLPVATSYIFAAGRSPYGYDVLSDADRAEPVQAAIANKYGSSTGIVPFISASDQSISGIVLYRPVLAPSGEVTGIVSGSIEIERLLDAARGASPDIDRIALEIGDLMDEVVAETRTEQRIIAASPFTVTYGYIATGRPWHVIITGSPPVAETMRGLGAVALVLLAGFGAAAAIHGYGKSASRGAALRAAQHTLRRTLDGLEPLVWMTTPEGHVVEANRTAANACGLPPGEIVGRNLATLPLWGGGGSERRALESAVSAAAGGAERRLDVTGADAGDIQPIYDVSLRPVAGEAGAITRLVVSAHDVTERVQASATMRLMMRELDHRMKNTLQVIQGIIRRTARGHSTVETFESALLGRIGTMARAHGLLAEERWMGADLRTVILQELEPFDEAHSAQVSGPPIRIHPRGALAFSMAVHELGTNATKYGALSVPQGRVAIDWAIDGEGDDRSLVFSWRESNGPTVEEPTRRGFGSLLLERSLAYDLDGQTHLEFRPSGLVCHIVLPWERVRPAMTRPGRDALVAGDLQ